MKHVFMMGMALVTALALTGCSGLRTPEKSRCQMAVAGPAVLDNKGVVDIHGTGFEPGSGIMLLFTADDGVQSDIGYALDPPPRADHKGNWQTSWSFGRYVKKKLLKTGEYTITAVNSDFEVLGEARVTFSKE